MTYAYARVSAQDQNLTRQTDSFTEFGINKKNIFCDKQSGKDFERENYQKLLAMLNNGDLLVIKSIDRLGRNYDQIISEWNKITNIIGADILVMDMPLLDTRTKAETLVGKFISDIVLQVLSFVAENERENIKTRQTEGIIAAKERGIQFGRPKAQYSKEFLEVVQAYLDKQIPLRVALNKLSIKQDNFYYHVKKIKNEAQNSFTKI